MHLHLSLLTIILVLSQLVLGQVPPPPPPPPPGYSQVPTVPKLPTISENGKLPNNYLAVAESDGLFIYHTFKGRGIYSKNDAQFRTLDVFNFFSNISTKLNGKKLFRAQRNRKYGVIDEFGDVVVPHEYEDIVVLYQDKGFLGIRKGHEPAVFAFNGDELLGCERAKLFIPGEENLSVAAEHPNYAVFSIFDTDKCEWLHWRGDGHAIKNETVTLLRVLKLNGDGKKQSVYNGKGEVVWSDNNLMVTSFISDEYWGVRNKEGKNGIIKSNGAVFIPIVYDHYYWVGKEFVWATNDFEGYDLFTIGGDKFAESSRRPVDLKGLTEYAIVYNKNGLAGVVNKQGEVIIPQKYSKIYRASGCGFSKGKKVFAELYGKTDVYSDDLQLLTKYMYDDFSYTRKGDKECSIIAGIDGLVEILDSNYKPIAEMKFVSFFHDCDSLKDFEELKITPDQFNATTLGWLIDEKYNKFILLKSGEIVTIDKYLSDLD